MQNSIFCNYWGFFRQMTHCVSLARFRVSGCVTKQLDLCSVLCETVNDSERETDMRKIINTTLNYEGR